MTGQDTVISQHSSAAWDNSKETVSTFQGSQEWTP